MSIFPVKINDWFEPLSSGWNDVQDVLEYHRCYACGDKVKMNKGVVHHAIAYGHGYAWCSVRCFESGKKARPDKRRERRLSRRFREF